MTNPWRASSTRRRTLSNALFSHINSAMCCFKVTLAPQAWARRVDRDCCRDHCKTRAHCVWVANRSWSIDRKRPGWQRATKRSGNKISILDGLSAHTEYTARRFPTSPETFVLQKKTTKLETDLNKISLKQHHYAYEKTRNLIRQWYSKLTKPN